MRRFYRFLIFMTAWAGLGCGVEPPPAMPRAEIATAGGVGDEPDEPAGRSVAFAEGGFVMVVNPRVNAGSTLAIAFPRERAGIGIEIGPRGNRTDATGLVVVDHLPVGTAVVEFNPGQVHLAIEREGLVDAIVRFDPDEGPELISSVHYPLDGPDVIRLAEGVHAGTLELAKDGAILYGEIDTTGQLATMIDGDLIIRASGVRVRNVRVAGRVIVQGFGASVAFSEMDGAIVQAANTLLLRNTLHTRPVVAAPNVLLADNVVVR